MQSALARGIGLTVFSLLAVGPWAVVWAASGPATQTNPTKPQTATAAEEPLQPIPESAGGDSFTAGPPPDGKPVAVEAASFKGVIPGVSTQSEVEKAWGTPTKIAKQADGLIQLYSVAPFKHVEVRYGADHKAASIVIRFEKAYPLSAVVKQLALTPIRPVLVSSDLGEPLGLSYPERGVLLAFEPGKPANKPSMKVNQIVLDPIAAEPFLLRAENTLARQPQSSRRDLEQALSLEHDNARGQWLYSRALLAAEDYAKALQAASEAERLEPGNAHYRITRAQVLGQLGQLAEGLQEAQKAAELAEKQPHLKARALCLQGDLLASGPKPDYRKALQLHTQAIQEADPLSSDPHPAVRLAAKEVIIDGHLGAAHDIAWGNWKEKDTAVPRWLERAAAVADDLVNNEGGSEEQRFRVYARILAADVGMHGGMDPAEPVKQLMLSGEKLIASTNDPVQKAHYQWDLGIALYDALQVSQARSQLDEALKYGEDAVAHLEKGGDRASAPANAFLLGRLYFRLGALHAARDHDHQAAVTWFDKALPRLDSSSGQPANADAGRHGQMLVSMAVSYWQVGQRDKAVALSQKGITMMEQAVQAGKLDSSSLVVPYRNLSTMHRQLGANDQADRFQEMANRVKAEKAK